MLMSASVWAQTAPVSPDTMIKNMADDVLASIKADKDIQAGDPQRILALVDSKILPFVDFRKMTQLAAARFWRTATPQQQEALVKEFRTTLVRTYGGAVSAVKDQTSVQLRPLRMEPNATDVVVRTFIDQLRSEPIQIDYRLAKTVNSWLIYDVNILGVWLVENYKNQFGQQVAQGGIDGLIQALAQKNQSFEASALKNNSAKSK